MRKTFAVLAYATTFKACFYATQNEVEFAVVLVAVREPRLKSPIVYACRTLARLFLPRFSAADSPRLAAAIAF